VNSHTQTLFKAVIKAFNEDDSFTAKSLVEKILFEGDENYDAVFELGINLTKLHRYQAALIVFQCLQIYSPSDVKVLFNLGIIYTIHGNYQSALDAYDSASKIQPNDVEILLNKASIHGDLNKHTDALNALDLAIEIKPDFALAWSNKGVSLYRLGRTQEALDSYNTATNLDPHFYEAWSNKSVPLLKLKRLDDALVACNTAITINPDYAEGWSNKGNVLQELKRYDEAITHYDRALSLNPDYAEGWSNKGNVLQELKRYDEAITHYDRALSLNPDIELLYGDFLHTKMRVCDWSNFDDLLRELTSKLAKNPSASNPFPLLALVDDPRLHKTIAENYSKNKNPTKPLLEVVHKRSRNKKIRIGYYSADFRNHPVAFLIAGLIEAHDQSQFEVFLFSYLNATDEMNVRLRKACSQFIDIQTSSDEQAAALSRELNIDIAVDLTGFTQGARPLIFSYRAAPVQVSYLGYPGTMGSNYYDYIIADNTVIPESSKTHYSEKIVWLPHTYQANDSKRLIGSRFFTREELGLPKKGFIFCCFNNNFKILPPIFDSWMRILNSVEGSSLWLFEDNKYAHANLKLQAEMRGIDPSRLIFAERLDLPEHLARHRLADLFLDTAPYNAHTTASDALWSGLPVLTLIGQSFPARVAASLLHAIGLPELITHTLEEYEALAIRLAKNPDEMAVIKEKLAANRLTMPLFNTPLFTKDIEAAYIKMYGCYQENLLPGNIDLT
jgi:predicted O-linked N-acetylglucosamine transferase (SPINDLY family)